MGRLNVFFPLFWLSHMIFALDIAHGFNRGEDNAVSAKQNKVSGRCFFFHTH